MILLLLSHTYRWIIFDELEILQWSDFPSYSYQLWRRIRKNAQQRLVRYTSKHFTGIYFDVFYFVDAIYRTYGRNFSWKIVPYFWHCELIQRSADIDSLLWCKKKSYFLHVPKVQALRYDKSATRHDTTTQQQTDLTSSSRIMSLYSK